MKRPAKAGEEFELFISPELRAKLGLPPERKLKSDRLPARVLEEYLKRQVGYFHKVRVGSRLFRLLRESSAHPWHVLLFRTRNLAWCGLRIRCYARRNAREKANHGRISCWQLDTQAVCAACLSAVKQRLPTSKPEPAHG